MTVPRNIHIGSPVPWVEKYRPRCLDEIAAQSEVTLVLKRSLTGSNLPHLLFHGPPGTGKTSTILALARDLFGEHFKDRVLELNASDERGIAVVRNKIKNFAKAVVSQGTLRSASNREHLDLSLQSSQESSNMPIDPVTCPSFKLIILDEADSMTYDAQAALRRTMETYSATTRFCIICNYANKIIEPLSSRCAKFRFKAVDLEAALDRLLYIVKCEEINIKKPVLRALISLCDGDLRKAINYMQGAHRLVSNGSASNEISMDLLQELTGTIPNSYIEVFLKNCGSNFALVQSSTDELNREGFSIAQFLYQLHEHILEQASLGSVEKSLISLKLSNSLKCLLDGADGHLQLLSLGASIYNILTKKGNDPILI